MSVELIDFKSGKSLKVINGQYVIGGGGACKQESCLKGKIIDGKYWIDNCGNICNCADFKKWWIDNIGEWGEQNTSNSGKVTWNKCSDEIEELDFINGSYSQIPESICAMNITNSLLIGINQKLTRLPKSMWNMEYKHLILLQASITNLPENISNLKNLQWLVLYDIPLNGLPENISNLKNLQWLVLYDIPLNGLPENIINLNNLVALQLGKFPLDEKSLNIITKMSNLQYIQIGNTKIEELPENIGNLTELKELVVEGCQLKSIPDSIGNLKKIETVSFGSNQLEKLPDSISNLDKDNILVYLKNNNFTDNYKEHIKNDLFPIANANGNLYL